MSPPSISVASISVFGLCQTGELVLFVSVSKEVSEASSISCSSVSVFCSHSRHWGVPPSSSSLDQCIRPTAAVRSLSSTLPQELSSANGGLFPQRCLGDYVPLPLSGVVCISIRYWGIKDTGVSDTGYKSLALFPWGGTIPYWYSCSRAPSGIRLRLDLSGIHIFNLSSFPALTCFPNSLPFFSWNLIKIPISQALLPGTYGSKTAPN